VRKHLITHVCGHQEEAPLYGEEKDFARQIACLEERDCSPCLHNALLHLPPDARARYLKYPPSPCWTHPIEDMLAFLTASFGVPVTKGYVTERETITPEWEHLTLHVQSQTGSLDKIVVLEEYPDHFVLTSQNTTGE